jgi:hypothetical protein
MSTLTAFLEKKMLEVCTCTEFLARILAHGLNPTIAATVKNQGAI